MHRISFQRYGVRQLLILYPSSVSPVHISRIKVFLFTFLRAFEFELAVPASEIKKQMSGAVHRPMIKSDPEAGSQLPLIVRRR